jgi:hypothetical protein
MRTAFPDQKLSVDHLVQTETDVTIAYTIHGIQKGDFSGPLPTEVSETGVLRLTAAQG